MNRRQFAKNVLASAAVPALLGIKSAFGASDEARLRKAIDDALKPAIAKYGLPGVAVGLTIDGARHFVEYGSASPKAHVAVTRDTLFELGSISKTFTATLATLAEIEGKLSLYDTVGAHMPELKDHPIGNVRLLDLGTHTGGGFPLQLPAGVDTDAQLMNWYRSWTPKYAAGAMRTYANPSIALLGKVTARAMGQSFQSLAQGRLFPALGLKRTFIAVPKSEMPTYAWGTNGEGKAVRVSPSPISTEAYGVKSNAVDMVAFLEANMSLGRVPDPVARAVLATHTGYYRTGPFIQDLIWEQYLYPAKLDDMVEGNSVSFKPVPATAIEPPMPPRADAILNKTGSTGGFGAYVVLIPAKKAGMVILANKGYPNPVRTRVAWQVLSQAME
jgi:beta-lactamase class C